MTKDKSILSDTTATWNEVLEYLFEVAEPDEKNSSESDE